MSKNTKPHDSTDLLAVIRQIWEGERDEDALCASLDLEDLMVVMAIVAGIANLSTLLPP
jgi:hypothetical protein